MTSWAKTLGTAVDIRTLQADPHRGSLSVFNKHLTAIVYMKEGGSVSTSNGIPVYPGGNVGLNLRDDGETVQEPWSMISDTANTPIVIFEGSP